MTVTKAKTFRNIIYTSLGKGLTLVCVALASLVVARNLTPSDYGVVGFAGIIIGFLGQFSDMGVSNAVVRRPELHQHDLDTAFTLKIVLGFGAFIVALLIAPYAHHLFEHPATGNVVRILALNFLVSTIGFVPQAILTREMNFRALVVPGVAAAVVQCILTVTLVLRGWSFWSVIIANVGATLASGIILQLAKRYPIRLRFDWTVVQEYLRFGIPLFGTGVLVFLIFNLDNFLVGASLGSAQLGYYALAFTWGSFICGLLSSTVHGVLFPAFSAIQNDTVAVRRWYLKTVELVAFIAVIVNAALFANAHFFLVTFLGKGTDKWLPATMALRILCMYGILRAVTEPLAPFLMARGETRVLWRANLLIGAVEVFLLLLALRSGRIELVAAAVLVAYACAGFFLLPYLRHEFSISIGDVLARIWPVIPALGLGWITTGLLASSFGNTFFTLGIRGLFTASVVALTHGILTRFRCFQEARGMIVQNFARVGG
ncbi:MAG TPA: lipopolysaccharide biosynthesis protein [Terracidiphilus sp.]|nr:lipopolysaccharide biosynthesis protein [Terracidiphilus sp.]